MKRAAFKRIRKVSSRQRVIKRCDALLRQVLLKTRKNKCEWCGEERTLHLAHILPKGTFPLLRFHRDNILLLCFFCHMIKWHRNPLEAAAFLKELKGENYEIHLKSINKGASKLNLWHLSIMEAGLKEELK